MKYFCYWEADEWPSEGLIEVVAETPSDALIKAEHEMEVLASMNEGPQLWHWVYQPSTVHPIPSLRE